MNKFYRSISVLVFCLILTSGNCLLQDDVALESDLTNDQIQIEIDNYLANVRKIFQLHNDQSGVTERGRARRETSLGSAMLHANGVDRFSGFFRMYQLPARFTSDIVLFCLPLEVHDCYAVTLEADSPDAFFSNRMVLYKFQENNFTKVDEIAVKNASTLATYFIQDYQHVVVADYVNGTYGKVNTIADGYHVYRINHLTAKFESVQTLSDRRLNSVHLWEHKSMGATFLAVATGATEDFNFDTESHIFKWLGTYFDKIDTIKTYNPKCITPFMIGSAMYLAVANFQNNRGETDIDSEIFRFSLDREKFTLHQKLRTHAARDIKYFCFDTSPRKESFLVVANQFVREPDGSINYDTYSIIYKYSEDEYFIPFQSFRIHSAIQWLPVIGGIDQFLLLVASEFYGVKAYQYDGWRFVETDVQYSRESFGVGISTMRQFQFNNENVFTIANKYNDGTKSNIFSVVYERDDTLPNFHSEMESWCRGTLKEVEDNYSNMSELVNSVADVPRVNDSVIKINSDLILNHTAKVSDITVTSPAEYYNESAIENYQSIANFINDKKVELDKLENLFEEVPSALFQKTEHFGKVEFDCYPQPCNFNELHIEMLNGENLSTLLKNSLNLQSDLKLISDDIPLEFDYIAVQNPIDVSYVNNHRLDDLLTKQSMRNLNQKVIVVGDVIIDNSNGITVAGSVDKVRISNDSVLMINGSQDFSGKTLMVDSLNISDLIVRKTFNGVPLGDKLIYKRDSLEFPLQLNVNELTIQDGKISGVDLKDMFHNVMKLNADEQVVKGYHWYDSLQANEVTVNGNLIQVPVFPVMPEFGGYSRVTAMTGFQDYYKEKPDDFRSRPDGQHEEKEKNVTTERSYPTEVTDSDEDVDNRQSKFSDFISSNSSKKIKPVKSHVYYNEDVTYEGDVIVDGRLIIKGGTLKVIDLILLNDYINLTDLINNALRLDEVNIDEEFVFKTPFKSETLQVYELNGIKPEMWLPNGKNGTVTGLKSFNSDINFRGGVIVSGSINGINVTLLEKNINNTQRKETDIISPEVDKDDLRSASLSKENIKINDEDKIVINATVIVRNDVNVRTLLTDDDNYINGISVNDFIESVVNNATENFDGHKIFMGNLTIDNLFCDDIEGFNIKTAEGAHFCETVELRPDSSLVFLDNENITVHNLSFTGTLDGVTHDEFGKWLLTDGDQEIIGEQTLNSVEILGGIKIASGIINGVNITELFENGIRTDETAYLSGIFFDSIKTNNVEVSGLLNGFINISDDIILQSLLPSDSQIIISGDKILMNDLEVDNIYADSIKNMCEFFSPSDNIKSLVVNGSVMFSKEPDVNLLNNINVQSLFEFAWFTYDDKVINASVYFTDVVFHNNIDLKGSLNNVNVEQLNKQYLSLTSDQTISSPIVFSGGIIVNGQLHSKKVTVGRYIDGIMIEQFVNNVLLNGTDQIITGVPDFLNITVLGDFETTGLINDLNITSDVLILNGDNMYNDDGDTVVISGRTLIKDVKTNELIVKPKSLSKIQNINFENWFKSAVKINGNYVVNGDKVFNSGISASKDIKVEGLVNGIKFDKENILLSYYDQLLTGNNLFDETSDLTFNNFYTNHSVNNVDINDLIEKLVYKNEDIDISGNKVFWSEIYGHNVILPDQYGEINLTKLNDNLLNFDKYKAYLFDKEFKTLRNIEKNVELSILGQAFLLKGWKKIQQLKGSIQLVVPLKTYRENDVNMIGVISFISNKFFLTIHEWKDSQFVIKQGSRFSLKFNPHIISPVPTHETESGLKPNKLFIVSKDEQQRLKENATQIKKKTDGTDFPLYNGWLFGWNTSSHNVPKYNWVVPMYHPGLLLHVYDTCYVLFDYKEGSFCRLYCENNLVHWVNCSNAVQGIVTSDGDNSYVLIFRKNYIRNYVNMTDVNKQYTIDVWKFNDNKMELVVNLTMNNNPYSVSAVYDSDTKQHIVAVTSGAKLIMYRFNNSWSIHGNSSVDVSDKTTVKMRLLPTKEILLILASPCTKLSSQIWVGGISDPKKIPIDIRGNEIKQIIPIRLFDKKDTKDDKNDYDSYIVVTDLETAVFEPIYTL